MRNSISQQINQDGINAILWKACDTFRGTVDPAEYKNNILVMLFLKYISDVWIGHYDTCLAETGSEVQALRKMRYERFVLPEGTDYNTLYALRNEVNIGEEIDKALEAIEVANIQKLEGVFRNISFSSETVLGQTGQRNARLKNLLEDFAYPRLDMRPSRINGLDIIGNTYKYPIGKFAAGAGTKGGEFYTPAEGSRLIKCTHEVGSQRRSWVTFWRAQSVSFLGGRGAAS